MKLIFALVLAGLAPNMTGAQESVAPAADPVVLPSADHILSEFLWHKRPIVVFADSPEDPRFAQQIELINEDLDRLRERDVVVLTDSDPAAKSPLRMKLRPRGFMLVLIGKDGQVELRKPLPLTVRELTRTIDKMPNRQREVEERRGS